MTQRLEALVRSQWVEAGLPGRPPARLSFHLFEGTPGAHGVVSFHVFREGDTAPVLVGKIPRDGLARRHVVAEHELLEELEEAAPRLGGVAFPRSVWLGDRWDRVATAQPAIRGRRLDPDPETVLEAARGWFARFRRVTGLIEGTEAARWEPFLRSAHFFRETFLPTGALRFDLASLIVGIEARHERTTLCGFSHGSPRASDFVRTRAGLFLGRWEHGETRQFPWLDPLHLALDLALGGRDDPVLAFEEWFLEDGERRDVTFEFLRACLEDASVPDDALPLALPATLLSIVHRQTRLDGPEAESTRRWVAVLESCLTPESLERLDLGTRDPEPEPAVDAEAEAATR